jgi:hypothetical protein
VRVTGSEPREAFVRTFQLDGMVTAGGLPIRNVRVVRGVLVGEVASPEGPVELTGAGFQGVHLHALLDCADGATPRRLEASLDEVSPDRKRPEGHAWLYRVKILDAPAPQPRWACEADEEGETGAIPFEGVWDTHGDHHAQPGAFSFACTEAAAAKCVRWGYRPWEAERNAHAACTRMARADYCGDGHTATRKGTEINLWDSENRVARAASQKGATFEAAWTPEGAACMGHARWPEDTDPCPGRKGSGLNEYNVPVCHSPAEAEALVGKGKVLLFDESSIHHQE